MQPDTSFLRKKVFFPKPLNELTIDDIKNFIEQKIPEGKELEYKSQLLNYQTVVASKDKNPNTQKREHDLLAAISSFANTEGGYLLIGIEANNGLPKSINGIIADSSDHIKQAIENLLSAGLDPRINIGDYEIFPVPSKKKSYVIVIHVQKSWTGPHRLCFNESSRFYGRNSSGRFVMDTDQIKSAILFSESIVTKIKDFQKERIEDIKKQLSTGSLEIPARVTNGSFITLHAIPLNSFKNNECDWKFAARSNYLLPLLGQGTTFPNTAYNLNGFIRMNNVPGSDVDSYTQLYRNGIVETVDKYVIAAKSRIEGKNNIIDGPYFFGAMNRQLQLLFFLYKAMDVSCPVYLFSALLNVKGYKMKPNTNSFHNSKEAEFQNLQF